MYASTHLGEKVQKYYYTEFKGIRRNLTWEVSRTTTFQEIPKEEKGQIGNSLKLIDRVQCLLQLDFSLSSLSTAKKSPQSLRTSGSLRCKLIYRDERRGCLGRWHGRVGGSAGFRWWVAGRSRTAAVSVKGIRRHTHPGIWQLCNVGRKHVGDALEKSLWLILSFHFTFSFQWSKNTWSNAVDGTLASPGSKSGRWAGDRARRQSVATHKTLQGWWETLLPNPPGGWRCWGHRNEIDALRGGGFLHVVVTQAETFLPGVADLHCGLHLALVDRLSVDQVHALLLFDLVQAAAVHADGGGRQQQAVAARERRAVPPGARRLGLEHRRSVTEAVDQGGAVRPPKAPAAATAAALRRAPARTRRQL